MFGLGVNTTEKTVEDEWDEFDQKRDEFERVTDDLEDRASKLRAAIKAARNQIDKGSFGLNQKDPKNKKIIAQVAKDLSEALDYLDLIAKSLEDAGDKLNRAVKDSKRLLPSIAGPT